MKRRLKKSLFSCFLVFILLAFSQVYVEKPRAAAGIWPEKIRIGIFFNDTNSHNVSTAVSSFNVSAEKGLRLGFYKGDDFVAIYEQDGPDVVTIRKDAYFVKDGNGIKEYNQSGAQLPEGEKIGPYHIEIGSSLKSLSAANSAIKSYAKKEVDAYPVYTGKWQVWSGFYTDMDEAEKAMKSIKKKLGSVNLSIVEPSPNRIVVSSNPDKVSEKILLAYENNGSFLRILPVKENKPYVLKLNNTFFRGEIEVRRLATSDMTVINILPSEEYLYGVVPCEIEASSHPEALKAQAVAARTYTLNSLGKHEKLGFDLCGTTWCQVYKGFGSENPASNKAVDDTKGKVVTYNGNLAQVFYFSSSGGMTENVENVWSTPLPYLVSVEDPYESGKSWKYNWELSLTAKEIEEIMLARKYDIGKVLSVAITKVAPSGRAIELVIKGTKGRRVYTKGECRSVFSGLYSQLYTIFSDADIHILGNDKEHVVKSQIADKNIITSKGVKSLKAFDNTVTVIGANNVKRKIPTVPTTYKFVGRGNGHAVGMSQEGAKGMANAGFKYDEILMHYFQGTKVE